MKTVKDDNSSLQETVSAVMDGEVKAHILPDVIKRITRSESQKWARYHLIRDVLTQSAQTDPNDIVNRVQHALEKEPPLVCHSRWTQCCLKVIACVRKVMPVRRHSDQD